jgi:hypothetical protein
LSRDIHRYPPPAQPLGFPSAIGDSSATPLSCVWETGAFCQSNGASALTRILLSREIVQVAVYTNAVLVVHRLCVRVICVECAIHAPPCTKASVALVLPFPAEWLSAGCSDVMVTPVRRLELAHLNALELERSTNALSSPSTVLYGITRHHGLGWWTSTTKVVGPVKLALPLSQHFAVHSGAAASVQ